MGFPSRRTCLYHKTVFPVIKIVFNIQMRAFIFFVFYLLRKCFLYNASNCMLRFLVQYRYNSSQNLNEIGNKLINIWDVVFFRVGPTKPRAETERKLSLTSKAEQKIILFKLRLIISTES